MSLAVSDLLPSFVATSQTVLASAASSTGFGGEDGVLSAVPGWLFVVFAGVLGSLFGSFLNVVIYRLPRRCVSISKPRGSFCPKCKKPIAWYDNIPMLSYVVLNARCRRCKARISLRYPLVEFFAAAVFALIVWLEIVKPGVADDGYRWMTAGTHAFFAVLLIACALIDWDLTVLPDQLTLGGTVAMLLLAALNPYHGGVPFAAPESASVAAFTPVDVGELGDDVPLEPGIRYWESSAPTTEERRQRFTINARVREQAPVVDAFGGEPAPWPEPTPPLGFDGSGEPELDADAAAARLGIIGRRRYESLEGRARSVGSALFGALVAGGGLWVLGLVMTIVFQKKAIAHGGGSAMGFGDVKLLMLFGAVLGWPGAALALLLGAMFGIVVGLPRLAMTGKHGIPFGPFLAAAALVICLFYADILSVFYDLYVSGFESV